MEIKTSEIIIDGVKLKYHIAGHGRPFFLINAFHSDMIRILPLIRELSRQFTVIYPELPGMEGETHLNGHKYTARNYAHFLGLLLQKLKLENYILGGICYGAVIITWMLHDFQIKPANLFFVEALYDSTYIHVNFFFTTILRIVLNKKNARFLNFIIRHFVRNPNFLNLFFRIQFYKEKNIRDVVQNQIRLTTQMKPEVWVDAIYDIYDLRFDALKLVSEVPTILVYPEIDNILDIPKTIKGLKNIFPNSKVVYINFTKHAPSGTIDQAFVTNLVQPLTKDLNDLAIQ